MTFADGVSVLREFGFPTFFCMWLMYKQDKANKTSSDNQTKQLVIMTVMARALGVYNDVAPELDGPTIPVRSRRLDETGVMKTISGKETP